MPHPEASLDHRQIALLMEKLRSKCAKDEAALKDVLEIIQDSVRQSRNEPADEMALVICEILEPERLGGLVWMTCRKCGERLDKQEVENKVDTCFSCRVGPPPGGCW